MKRFLPFLLILLGIAEIVLAFAGIQPPLLIAILLGVLLVGLGVKTLLDTRRK